MISLPANADAKVLEDIGDPPGITEHLEERKTLLQKHLPGNRIVLIHCQVSCDTERFRPQPARSFVPRVCFGSSEQLGKPATAFGQVAPAAPELPDRHCQLHT